MSSINLLAAGLFALALTYTLHTIYTKLTHARLARQLHCKPAHIRPHRLPLGIDTFQRYMHAASTQNSQNDDLAVYEELGCRATWNQNLLGFWQHMTADPRNVQALLANQFEDFELGPVRRGVFEPLIGHGIFTSDGKDWERSRGLLRPQFARGQVSDLNMVEAHVQNLWRRLDVQADGWTSTVDLAPLFFNLTLDSATEFLFGQSALSQLVPLRKQDKAEAQKSTTLDWSGFGKHFDAANATVTIRSRFLDLYFLYNPRSFQNDCREVHKYVDHVVDEALKRHNNPGGEKNNRYVFLTHLLKATQDRTELRSQLLNILLAGRDTTAGLLGWTFYYLARHPDIYTKLRQNILHTFGTATDTITFESLKSCTYLQHLLREVLRLEPLVPENARRAVRNTTLPSGGGADGLSPIYIRRGEEVAYNVFIMHHRKDIWGADADVFRPERWEERKKGVGWEYLPFNGGPRICLGQQFALTEAGYVVVRIVQRFERLEGVELGEGPTLRRFTATTSPVEVKVRLREAGRGE
ncbi:hypothetical protein M409DRAFT_28936 [Zasmidium cellare ATCC 36951]|uniref:Cytochrome P450 n=1 Tax=Zasmidium cellare ATCC 36951 TaxID=1080233 RepID=A0A6A6C3W6_ZASCE|nr:uncharacterized protein M409DRAFT_28936 [Zasmidium cellare ATCC 36951]KAF2160552.1 hypothetical protein M409DRAFT_28936 [Zasmidium cellare ATCC 36951]